MTSKPICPFMSGRPLPMRPDGKTILGPNESIVAPMRVECAAHQCALWDAEFGVCGMALRVGVERPLITIGQTLSEIVQLLTPPTNGSPISRMANALEEMITPKPSKGG